MLIDVAVGVEKKSKNKSCANVFRAKTGDEKTMHFENREFSETQRSVIAVVYTRHVRLKMRWRRSVAEIRGEGPN